MVRVRHTAGIGEVSSLATQRLGLFIHILDEVLNRTGDRRRQHIGRLARRLDQQALEQLLYGQLLSRPDIGAGGIRLQVLPDVSVCRQYLVQGQVPRLYGIQHQQRGHHLGQTGRIDLLIRFLGIQHRVRIQIL